MIQKRRRVKGWYWGVETGKDSTEVGKGYRKERMKILKTDFLPIPPSGLAL